MARDRDTEVDPSLPNRQDVDALLAGGYIPPERMAASWTLLVEWLEDLASAHRAIEWNPQAFERIEWDLARAGLASDYSLRRLAERALGSPLRVLEGQVVGYAKHVHAVETLTALNQARSSGELEPETAEFIAPIVDVLEVAAGQDALDVVVVSTP